MRKIFVLLLVVAFLSLLFACDNGSDEVAAVFSGISDSTLTIGDTFDPMQGVSATDQKDGDITSSVTFSGVVNLNVAGTYVITYRVVGSDGKEVTATRTITVLNEDGCGPNEHKVDGICVPKPKEEIVIMHGAPFEVNPFHENYTGTQQLQRQTRQLEVEEQFNVKITYKAYPANAPWGPDRAAAIIQSSVSNDHLADIYWSVSDWIQTLARAEAIVPIDQYLEMYGSNIHQDYLDIGSYKEQVYGFNEGKLTADKGLYYNANLVASLGVDNPTDLFLDGQWTWSRFDTWATQVQTALNAIGDENDQYFALGGVAAIYAESMVPLNGGNLVNLNTGRIAFHQTPALDTYNFIRELHLKNLFEPAPSYDAGSPLWQAGKVAMHPGQFWFLNADNRWLNLNFELGFVPYPVSDTFEGQYVTPISGVALYHVASGMTPEREQLAFQVWNELQLWKTETQMAFEFELLLNTRFDRENYVTAYMQIYDSIYLELIDALGISTYNAEYGFRSRVNFAIREGDIRTVMDAIRPTYQLELDKYLE
jgi:fructooligosaccharide transport system substrate-binding protein